MFLGFDFKKSTPHTRGRAEPPKPKRKHHKTRRRYVENIEHYSSRGAVPAPDPEMKLLEKMSERIKCMQQNSCTVLRSLIAI